MTSSTTTAPITNALRSRPLSALIMISCLLALLVSVGAALPQQAPASGSTWTWQVKGGCVLGAGLASNTPQNWFNTGGYISCGSQTGTRRAVCKAVHRHGVYWHSHATSIDSTRNSNFKMYSQPIYGTNGDTYKTNCKFYRSGLHLATVESPGVRL